MTTHSTSLPDVERDVCILKRLLVTRRLERLLVTHREIYEAALQSNNKIALKAHAEKIAYLEQELQRNKTRKLLLGG